MSLCALETGLTFEEFLRRLILCCYEVTLVQLMMMMMMMITFRVCSLNERA